MRPRIKICGITRPEDGALAASLGADAIGLVFYDRSPRNIGIEQARAVVAALPPLTQVVALFLDPQAELVQAVLREVSVDVLQFHGAEPAAFCERFGRRYMKALGMGGDADPRAEAAGHPRAAGFLLDSHVTGAQGGSGHAFDWERIPADLGRPYLLAGGLDPNNVAQAIQRCRPYGVDVSSGVEAGKGIKDAGKLAAFINEVNRVGH